MTCQRGASREAQNINRCDFGSSQGARQFVKQPFPLCFDDFSSLMCCERVPIDKYGFSGSKREVTGAAQQELAHFPDMAARVAVWAGPVNGHSDKSRGSNLATGWWPAAPM